jgi:hypothetical protein
MTRTEIEKRLKQIADEKQALRIGGEIIEGFQDQAAQLDEEEQLLKRDLEDIILGRVSDANRRSRTPMSRKEELKKQLDALREELDKIGDSNSPEHKRIEKERMRLNKEYSKLLESEKQAAPAAEPTTLSEPSQPAKGISEALSQMLELIAQAEQLTRRHEFDEALERLDQAEEYAKDEPDEKWRIKDKRTEVQKERTKAKNELVRKIRNALESDKPLPGDIQDWLDEYARIAPDEKEQIKDFRRQLARRRRPAQVREAIATVRQAIEPLLARAKALQAKNEVEAHRLAQEALDKVEALKRAYPNDEKVLALLEETRDQYNKVRARFRTALEEGAFGLLIQQYKEIQRKDAGVRLPYPHFKYKTEDGQKRLAFGTDPKTGEPILDLDHDERDTVPVSKIIEDLEGAARLYAEQKAEEKLDAAKEAIRNHDPRHAHDLLHGKGKFWGTAAKTACNYSQLHAISTEVGALELYSLADDWVKKVQQYFESAVIPALGKRLKAEKLRDDADGQAEVLTAWKMLLEAQRIDPDTPLLAETRERWHKPLDEYLRKEFSKVEELRTRHRWEQARNAAQSLLDLVQGDSELVVWQNRLAVFVQTCIRGEPLEVQVNQVLKEVTQLIGQQAGRQETLDAARQATERIKTLKYTIAEHKDAEGNPLFPESLIALLFPELNAYTTRLEARLNLNKALQDAERAAKSGDLTTVQQHQSALAEIQKEYPAHAEIGKTLDRLEARRIFLIAKRDYDAEKYRDDKQFQDLFERLGKVITLGGTDAEQAEKYRAEMEASQKELQQVEGLLDRVDKRVANLEGNTENERAQLRDALELLAPYRKKMVRRADEIDRRWDQITETLVTGLERALAQVESKKIALAETSDVLKWYAELESLDPDRAKRFKPLKARAHLLLAEPATSIKEQLDHILEAKQVAPDALQTEIQNRHAQIEKKRLLADLEGAFRNPDLQGRILDRLAAEFPSDPDIVLRHAEWYLTQEQFREARIELDRAEKIVSSIQPSDLALESRIAKLKKRADLEEKIFKSKQSIIQLLEPDRSIDEFEQARNEYTQLENHVKTSASDDSRFTVALENWWDVLVAQVVQKLEQHYRELETMGVPEWKAAQPMLKILRIQPDHLLARRIVSNLATNAVTIIPAKVKVLQNRVGGPPGGTADQSLELDIQETNDLLEEARAYKEALHQSDKPSGLNEAVNTLNQRKEDLESLKSQIDSIEYNLQHWARTGELRYWTDVEAGLNNINGDEAGRSGKFARHRRVQYLIQVIDSVKAKRERLLKAAESLTDDLQKEEYEQALASIQVLKTRHKNPQSPAPQDQYEYDNLGVKLEHIKLISPEELDRELMSLEIAVRQEADTIARIKNWLVEGIKNVVPWDTMPEEWLSRLDSLNTQPDIRKMTVTRAVDEFIRQCDFKSALLRCVRAIGVCDKELYAEAEKKIDPKALLADFESFTQIVEKIIETGNRNDYMLVPVPPARDRWSLRQSDDYFSHPPVEEQGLASSKAKSLVRFGRENVLVLIQKWKQEAEERRPEIKRRYAEFIGHLAQFDSLYEQVKKMDGSPLVRLPLRHLHPHAAQRKELVEQARNEYQKACKIAENGPGDPLAEILRRKRQELGELES